MNIEWTMFAIHLNTRLMAVSWPNHKSCVALTSSSFMITPGSLKSLSGRKNKVSMSWKRNVSMSMLEVRWLSEISKATGELRLFRRPRNPLERDRSGFRTASHSTTYLGLLATHCNHHCSRRQTKDWGGKQSNAFVYLGLQTLLYELHISDISCVRMMCCVTQLAWLAAQEHELDRESRHVCSLDCVKVLLLTSINNISRSRVVTICDIALWLWGEWKIKPWSGGQ